MNTPLLKLRYHGRRLIDISRQLGLLYCHLISRRESSVVCHQHKLTDFIAPYDLNSVSYTHLDVYKRQSLLSAYPTYTLSASLLLCLFSSFSITPEVILKPILPFFTVYLQFYFIKIQKESVPRAALAAFRNALGNFYSLCTGNFILRSLETP